MVHIVRPTICSSQSDGIRDVVLALVSVTSARNAESEGAMARWRCGLDRSNMVQLGYGKDSECLEDFNQELVWVVRGW